MLDVQRRGWSAASSSCVPTLRRKFRSRHVPLLYVDKQEISFALHYDLLAVHKIPVGEAFGQTVDDTTTDSGSMEYSTHQDSFMLDSVFLSDLSEDARRALQRIEVVHHTCPGCLVRVRFWTPEGIVSVSCRVRLLPASRRFHVWISPVVILPNFGRRSSLSEGTLSPPSQKRRLFAQHS